MSNATRGYTLLLLTLAAAAASYVRTALSPLQETIRAALALTDNQMALLQGPAMALPVVLTAVPLGLLIDRRSRVRLLFIFAVCNVAGSLLTAWSNDFTVLFAARSVIGLTGAATTSTAFSLLADLYAPAQRGRASMAVVVGQSAGISAAFALGGALLAVVGSGPDSWRWAMGWLTAPLVLVMLAILAMREPPRTGLAVKNPSMRESFVELWRYRAVIAPLMLGLILVEIAIGAELTWTAPAFTRAFTLSPERVGALIGTALMISGVAGPVAGGLLADLCQRAGGPRRTIWALSALSLLGAPAGLFAVMSQVGWASTLLVAFATIVVASVVAMTTLFTIVIPNELRGLCISIVGSACVVFGVGVAPMTVSWLSGPLGGPAAIGKALAAVCVTAGVLCAATCAFASRYFPRARRAR